MPKGSSTHFGRTLFVMLGLAVLGALVTLVPQKKAAASGGAPVNIISPVPLPVTGSVNANITNSTNSPVPVSGSLGVSGNVPVVNPLDASSNPTPLATLDALQPYEDSCSTTFNGFSTAMCNFRAVTTGKRLVIQEVDVEVALDSGLKPLVIAVNPTGSLEHDFPATFMGTSAIVSGTPDVFSTHQETRLYAGPNQTPDCRVGVSGFATNGHFNCQFSGFLVDVP